MGAGCCLLGSSKFTLRMMKINGGEDDNSGLTVKCKLNRGDQLST